MKPRPEAPPSGSKRARAVFDAALKRKQSERIIFIDGACGDDDALRTEVLGLLDASAEDLVSTVTAEDQATRIAPPADEPTRIAPPQPSPWRPGQPMEGRRIGPYQLLHSLGKGGMGSVYAASRADQEYKKIVAIKLVTSGLDSAEMLRRFRNERQVLAGLDHPCIAHLLDGGSTDEGLPYLVMEFVEGLPIDKYCDAHALSISDRLKLFQKVCSAVQFAHQNLVVHRDLKPANILVATNGEPKLLDFGIAKLMTAEFSAEEIELNRGEAQPMTLRYASPEQVRGEPITTASDIYSLGVLLYELLAGVHPFKAALTSRSEIEKAIRTQEPAKPSDAVKGRTDAATATKHEKQRTAKLVQELCGDIDTIVLTALQKQPRSRYPSAESFSWDITRYLNGFPVYARRDDMGYRARKFIRRHAASVIGAALVIVALIVSSIVSLQFAHTAQAERVKAQNRFNDVLKLAHFVLFNLDDKIREGETAQRKALVTEAVDYLNRLAIDAGRDASVQLELFEGYLKVGDRQGNPNVSNLGDTAGAKVSYTKALQVAEALRARNPKDTQAQNNVARVNIKLGDLSEYSDPAEALKNYRQAKGILESLGSADRSVQRSLLIASDGIGTDQGLLGDTSGALNSFQRSLQIAKELYAANPSDPHAHQRVALAYENLGGAMADMGAVNEALERLNMARSIYEELATASPRSKARRRDVVAVYQVIGDTLAQAGRQAEAVQSYREALKIADTLASEDPQNTQYQRDLYGTLRRLAVALGTSKEARQTTERWLKVLRPMAGAPNAPDYDLAEYCWFLVLTPFRELQAPALALHYARQLVQSSAEKNPDYLNLLAHAYDATDDPRQAAAAEIKALALFPPESASLLKTELKANLAKFRARAERKQSP